MLSEIILSSEILEETVAEIIDASKIRSTTSKLKEQLLAYFHRRTISIANLQKSGDNSKI